jgi:hypothetical protein
MKRYISKEFSSLKEASSTWELVPSANLRIAPFYSFTGYSKGGFNSVKMSFVVKNDKEDADIEKIREFIELEEVPSLVAVE